MSDWMFSTFDGLLRMFDGFMKLTIMFYYGCNRSKAEEIYLNLLVNEIEILKMEQLED